mgnify:CR=1 FL=1
MPSCASTWPGRWPGTSRADQNRAKVSHSGSVEWIDKAVELVSQVAGVLVDQDGNRNGVPGTTLEGSFPVSYCVVDSAGRVSNVLQSIISVTRGTQCGQGSLNAGGEGVKLVAIADAFEKEYAPENAAEADLAVWQPPCGITCDGSHRTSPGQSNCPPASGLSCLRESNRL